MPSPHFAPVMYLPDDLVLEAVRRLPPALLFSLVDALSCQWVDVSFGLSSGSDESVSFDFVVRRSGEMGRFVDLPQTSGPSHYPNSSSPPFPTRPVEPIRKLMDLVLQRPNYCPRRRVRHRPNRANVAADVSAQSPPRSPSPAPTIVRRPSPTPAISIAQIVPVSPPHNSASVAQPSVVTISPSPTKSVPLRCKSVASNCSSRPSTSLSFHSDAGRLSRLSGRLCSPSPAAFPGKADVILPLLTEAEHLDEPSTNGLAVDVWQFSSPDDDSEGFRSYSVLLYD